MPRATEANASASDYELTEQQKQDFLENGWIKLNNCFSREKAAAWYGVCVTAITVWQP